MNVGFIFTYLGTSMIMGGAEIARQGQFIEGSNLVLVGLSILIVRAKRYD